MDPLFNTSTYTVPQIVVFGVGCALWAVLYLILPFRNYFRYRFIEMPLGRSRQQLRLGVLVGLRLHV